MAKTDWRSSIGFNARRISPAQVRFFFSWQWPGTYTSAVIKCRAAALHGGMEVQKVETEAFFPVGKATLVLDNACTTFFSASLRSVQVNPGASRYWRTTIGGAVFPPSFVFTRNPWWDTDLELWRIAIGAYPQAFDLPTGWSLLASYWEGDDFGNWWPGPQSFLTLDNPIFIQDLTGDPRPHVKLQVELLLDMPLTTLCNFRRIYTIPSYDPP